ncbi:hypothetical protein BC943DRAFT_372358 [Umbelopsis sp. AD052]|nr:hypothetical protein BC943DRAFT_372358 [Umbelopsis sp. AD052]
MTPTNTQNRNLIPTTSVSTKLSEPLALPVTITPTKQPIEKPKPANLSIDIKPKIVKKAPPTQQPNSDNNNNEPIISYFIMLGDKIEDEETILSYREMSDAEKTERITKIFTRAASNGDARKIRHMLSQEQLIPFIDIDRQDEDGTTPLIYAACFGALDVLRALLEAGANPNRQDKIGWSALMWAANNNHEDIVRTLIEFGGCPTPKSNSGCSVFDFINKENKSLNDLLARNSRDSISSISSFGPGHSGRSSSPSSFGSEADLSSRDWSSFDVSLKSPSYDERFESDFDDVDEFKWDECLLHQMFVFDARKLPKILDTVTFKMDLPPKSRQEIFVPASIIYLCARFAHYYCDADTVEMVLSEAMKRLRKCVQASAKNVHALSFWLTNMSTLLQYLKRDGGLMIAAAEYHVGLSELISETYILIIADAQNRIDKILEPSMLEHEQIGEMEQVIFVDEWRFFRRGSSRRQSTIISSPDPATSLKRTASLASRPVPDSKASKNLSPVSIISLLSSTIYVFRSYHVQPSIIVQAMAQFLYYISCEIFNRILGNRKMLCRSKALQVRMNLSVLEEWVRSQRLPPSLLSCFDPVTQLLQLLQCLSQLQEWDTFSATVAELTALNALQIRRCVTHYRYEVNEMKLPEEVDAQLGRLLESGNQTNQQKVKWDESANRLSTDVESVESIGSTDRDSITSRRLSGGWFENDDEEIRERRDSKFILPFSLPTYSTEQQDISSKPEGISSTSSRHALTPCIPEDWMRQLDSI